MIPYVVFESFRLGPVTVYVWGLFVALGVLGGTLLAASRAKRRGIDPAQIFNLAIWVVVAGFLGARLWFLLEYGRDIGFTLGLVRAQDGGLSAVGGILGGLVGGWWYLRRHALAFGQLADIVAPGMLLGEGIGRLGCFSIHDHLGRPTAFPLSVNVFGVPRHDVGLELSLAGLAGALVLLLWERFGARPSKLAERSGARHTAGLGGVFALIWYALTRFSLDFLRATDLPVVDRRYGGLTLAQVAAIVGLCLGIGLFLRLQKKTRHVPRKAAGG
jgi:phosphatidylglycerol:prolipoprotein diacylglycerol transferase